MGVQVPFTSALLACIIISFINSNPPLCNRPRSASAFIYKRFSTLPSRAFISDKVLGSPDKRAFFRACSGHGASIFFINNSADRASIYYRRSSVAPASLTAIFRRIEFICLNLILNSANRTYLYFLCVFHAMYYNIIKQKYGAVILERFYTATGITPELVTE